MTWRDDVGETAYEPVRAGWEVLDTARSIAFTGEIEFALLPTAHVYFDRGRIYYAARDDDPDVADRLVAMGVVRPDDLARGVMVIDGTDHLGRLFDRVPSLDRERVLLALEQLTAETTAWIARQSVGTPQTLPYVFHPSGVHKWYAVAPAPARAAMAFPAPSPIERSRDRKPERGAEPVSESGDATSGIAHPAAPVDEPRDAGHAGPRDLAHDAGLRDFELRWPSGEVEAPVSVQPPEPVATTADGLDRFDHRADPHSAHPDSPPAVDDDHQSREMTIAVRRAMAAVTAGTARGRPVSAVVPVLDDAPDPFDRWSETSRRSATQAGSDQPGPPDPFEGIGGSPHAPTGSPLAPPMPSDRRALDDRRGALQRLIDGLRGD